MARFQTFPNWDRFLSDAGFEIDYLISDQDFSLLNSTDSANFLQVSQTFELNLTDTISLSDNAFQTLAELSDLDFLTENPDVDLNSALAVTLVIGVDTGGFYFAADNVMSLNTTIDMPLGTAVGTAGSATGTANLGVFSEIELKTGALDARVRPQEILNHARNDGCDPSGRQWRVKSDFLLPAEMPIDLEFGGRWIWKVDHTGFRVVAGFWIPLSAAPGFAGGFPGECDQLTWRPDITDGAFGDIFDSLPILGEGLSDELASVFSDAFSFAEQRGEIANYLKSRGFELLEIISPEKILDHLQNGTPLPDALIRLRHTSSTTNPVSRLRPTEELTLALGT